VKSEESIAFYLQLVEKMNLYLKMWLHRYKDSVNAEEDFLKLLEFFSFSKEVFGSNLKDYIRKLENFSAWCKISPSSLDIFWEKMEKFTE